MAGRGDNNSKEEDMELPAIGDVVWASHAMLWEAREPASVLSLNCEYEDDHGNEQTDGILVKFQVSNMRVVVPTSAIEAFQEEKKVEPGSSNRRSSRVSRTQAQKSPEASVHGGAAFQNTKDRAFVTPSPSGVNSSNYSTNSDEPGESKKSQKKRGRSVDAKKKLAEPRKKRAVSAAEERTPSANKSKPKTKSDMEASDQEGAASPYFAKLKAMPTSDEEANIPIVEVSATTKKVDNDAEKVSDQAGPARKPSASGAKKRQTKKPTGNAKEKSAASAKKLIPKKDLIIIEENGDDEEEDPQGGGYDSPDEDKPFQVEYATSGRATCRRCDEVILKGTLRVSHVPLFRGKPGYRVYRHLECSVFTEDIVDVGQIGGWRKIKRQSLEDYERLVVRVEESKLEIEKEKEELEPDELVQVNFEGEIRSAPPGLTATLLPFQIEGFSWMHHQEINVPEIRGGILADEMGMGKTLQTIATILDNRPLLQHSKPGAKHPPSLPGFELEARKRESEYWDNSVVDWRHELKMNNVSAKLAPKQPARGGTLVVCPVIALSQWKTEFEKFTEDGTVTIAIYHGPNRSKEFPVQKLCKYDIILTTYQVLEQDFRKMTSPSKVTCPNCNGKFKLEKLSVHLRYFCGEGAKKTEAQARQQRTRDGRNGSGNDAAPSRGKNGGQKGDSKKKSFAVSTSKKAKANNQKLSKPASKTNKKSKPILSKKEGAKKVDTSNSENEFTGKPPAIVRPSRSAARTASKLLASSVKDWSASYGDASSKEEDDESFGVRNSSDSDEEDEGMLSYEDEDSEGEAIVSKPQKKYAKSKKDTDDNGNLDDSDELDDSDSSNDAAARRARRKQAAALRHAKTGKSGKKTIKKGKGKKKFADETSSDTDSDDDTSMGDPLENIDLDELMEDAMEGAKMSILHSVCWWRVVLDEAHFIKSRSSQTAASAFALIGVNRWALSGTPLQNRVGELYSLIRFLRIDPMAHYFCRQKDCGCKSVHYRIKHGKCQDCGHRSFSHYAHFNRHVLNPIQRDGYSGDGRKAMFKLKQEVLDKCLLRRTKETRAEDLQLAPRIVSIRSIKLHPVELDFYNALYTQTKSSFDDYVAQGTLLNNYAHIFDLLTRMRQAVDHPYLIVYSKRNCEQARNGEGQPQVANGSVDCSLCQELPTERIVSSCCGAAFCKSCVVEYMATALDGDTNDNTPCPSCRDPFSVDLNQAASDIIDDSSLRVAGGSASPKNDNVDHSEDWTGPSLKELQHVNSSSILRRINLKEFATSTKIEALVQELVAMRKERPGSKALVFSQFVNMLDLIRFRLHSDPCLAEMGLGARILHGSMDVKARDACLKDFRENNNVRVLLMSLKAGGVALNLTVASEVFLVDNWWNPAAEMQAIDRTHRLGQHRCIRAVRFIAEGTVEERVLQLQEKKRLVFDGTVGRDAGSLKMLSSDDMASLFA